MVIPNRIWNPGKSKNLNIFGPTFGAYGDQTETKLFYIFFPYLNVYGGQ